MKTRHQEAINRLQQLHNTRSIIYGEDWLHDPDWMHLAMIKMKVRRLERFIIKNSRQDVYEKKIDTALDLANYSLFIAQQLLEEQHGRTKMPAGKQLRQPATRRIT